MIDYTLSLDLGGTYVRAAIVDSSFRILEVRREESIKNDADALLKQITTLIQSLPYEKYNIKTIGISSCGFVFDGAVKNLFNLGIDFLDLTNTLKKTWKNFSFFLANDANAAALYEAWNYREENLDSLLFLTISSGIGAGLVYRNQLIDLPFEVGHLRINYQNKFFELENLLSGNGIPAFCSINHFPVQSAQDFFLSVENKNPNALHILDEYTDLLSVFFSNMQLLFNLDRIVLSGGVLKSKDFFLDMTIKKAQEILRKYPLKPLKITIAETSINTGLIAGACLVFSNKKGSLSEPK